MKSAIINPGFNYRRRTFPRVSTTPVINICPALSVATASRIRGSLRSLARARARTQAGKIIEKETSQRAAWYLDNLIVDLP